MAATAPSDAEEFTAWMDRSGFVAAMRRRHRARVCICLAVAAAALASNARGPSLVDWPHRLVLQAMMTLSIASTFGAWFLMSWWLERDGRLLRLPQPDLASRARSVARYLAGRDLLMLAQALAGSAIIIVAGLVDVRAPRPLDTLVVLINLMPVAQFVWLGAKEMPDRKRLTTLYRVVAMAKPPA